MARIIRSKSQGCCCGGCSQVPRDDLLEQNALQPLQQYCCACVPKQICVSYTGPGGSTTAIIDVRQPCNPPGDTKTVYRGNIGLDSEVVDMDFEWLVEDEKCYLRLFSFNLSEDVRVEINKDNRRTICPRCQDCSEAKENPPALTFDLDNGGTVTVRPAANTSLLPLQRCCECDDPCDPPEEERGCFPVCADCDCICTSACITVLIDGEFHAAGQGQICNYAYEGGGAKVAIKGSSEKGGCCFLELVSIDGFDWGDDKPDDVPIDPLLNPCPRPVAKFDFGEATTGKLISVVFTCAGCGGDCDEVLNSCGCPAPKLLLADIESGACCGELSVPLIYQGEGKLWAGETDGWCGVNIRVELSCVGEQWVLGVAAANCEGLTGEEKATAMHQIENCQPFLTTFTVPLVDQNPETGPFCCLTGGAGGTTLVVTVSEAISV